VGGGSGGGSGGGGYKDVKNKFHGTLHRKLSILLEEVCICCVNYLCFSMQQEAKQSRIVIIFTEGFLSLISNMRRSCNQIFCWTIFERQLLVCNQL
jgi:hypothetical protein